MDDAHTGICVEYCYPIDGPATRGYIILLNDGDYSVEEIEVLFELAMIRYQRRFGEILFRPEDLDWPSLVEPRRRCRSGERLELHRVKRIQLIRSARPGIHPSVTELLDRLDAMVEEDRQVRFTAR